MRISKTQLIAAAVAAILMLASCEEATTSAEAEQQDQLLTQANAQAGMPAIVNFNEKKFLKMIIEMRDNPNLRTYTYTQALDGKLVKLCDSVGYGVPYAVQYTNPQTVDYRRGRLWVLPQADPNGLYSPASADGTWVACKDPKGGSVAPVFAEPRILVSQFPL
jgi:hypothetical protein